jgi:hypothetical protein
MKLVSICILSVYAAATIGLASLQSTWSSVVLNTLAMGPGLLLFLWLAGIPNGEVTLKAALLKVNDSCGPWKKLGLLLLFGINGSGVWALSTQHALWSQTFLCALALMTGIAIAFLMSWRAKIRAEAT